MHKLKVDLGPRSYPVFIGNGSLPQLGEMLEMYALNRQVLVVTDSNVHRLYAEVLTQSVQPHTETFILEKLRVGEKTKSLSTVDKLITRMLEQSFERTALVVAFGGGVIGDVAGFAASVYKRGVRVLQVPTTLLAQVDASIGGKTGINHTLGKNLIGTFHQPAMVWTDLNLLKTLPKREVVCGLAEIIKYGVIADADLFDRVDENLETILSCDSILMDEIVTRCCEIKAEIVAEDERESAVRMILNFGHTIGHALEATTGYKKLSHGEAVLLGMLAESKMASDSELLSEHDFTRIRDLIMRLEAIRKIKNIDWRQVMSYMKQDKKISEGNLRFVLPQQIGDVTVVENVKPDLIETGLKYLQSLEH